MSATNIEGDQSARLVGSVEESLKFLLVVFPVQLLLQDAFSKLPKLTILSVQVHVSKLVIGHHFLSLLGQNLEFGGIGPFNIDHLVDKAILELCQGLLEGTFEVSEVLDLGFRVVLLWELG